LGHLAGGLVLAALAFFLNAVIGGAYKVPISSAIGAIVLTLALLWARRAFRRVRAARKTDWNPWIWIRERHTSVYVESPIVARTESRLKVKILHDGISRIHLRLGWSGRGEIRVNVLNPGFTYHRPTGLQRQNASLVIDFDKPRGRGDTLELHYKVDYLAEAGGEPEPFYGISMLDYRVPDQIVIRFAFASGLGIGAIHKEAYLTENSLWPYNPPEEVQLDSSRSVEWVLPCRRRERYCLRWEFT
jgi:hypothetical protein